MDFWIGMRGPHRHYPGQTENDDGLDSNRTSLQSYTAQYNFRRHLHREIHNLASIHDEHS
jgi:hypothetical protein